MEWIVILFALYATLLVWLPLQFIPWYALTLIAIAYAVIFRAKDWPSYRSMRFWKLLQRYFRWEGILPDTWDRNDQYVFAIYPHGVFPIGHTLGFAMHAEDNGIVENLARNTRPVLARQAFFLPVVRELCLWAGCIHASRESISEALERGENVSISPGGLREVMYASCPDGVTRIVPRTGFLECAMKARAKVVPVLSVGDSEAYRIFEWFPRLQELSMRILKYPFPLLVLGMFGTPFPRRTPIRVVLGTPIDAASFSDLSLLYDRFYSDLFNMALAEDKPMCFYRDARPPSVLPDKQ